jgi:hypothetical protein
MAFTLPLIKPEPAGKVAVEFGSTLQRLPCLLLPAVLLFRFLRWPAVACETCGEDEEGHEPESEDRHFRLTAATACCMNRMYSALLMSIPCAFAVAFHFAVRVSKVTFIFNSSTVGFGPLARLVSI